jgi:hypothetical protein
MQISLLLSIPSNFISGRVAAYVTGYMYMYIVYICMRSSTVTSPNFDAISGLFFTV